MRDDFFLYAAKHYDDYDGYNKLDLWRVSMNIYSANAFYRMLDRNVLLNAYTAYFLFNYFNLDQKKSVTNDLVRYHFDSFSANVLILVWYSKCRTAYEPHEDFVKTRETSLSTFRHGPPAAQ